MSKIPRKQGIRDKFYMKKTFHLSQWIKQDPGHSLALWRMDGSWPERPYYVTLVTKF